MSKQPGKNVARRAVEELLGRLRNPPDYHGFALRIVDGVVLHPSAGPPARMLVLEGDVAEDKHFWRLFSVLQVESGDTECAPGGLVVFEGFEGPKRAGDGSVGVVLQFYLVRLGLRVRAWMSLQGLKGDGGES